MSVTGGFKTALPDRVPTWPRRACANAWQALATLLRPPRPKAKPIGRVRSSKRRWLCSPLSRAATSFWR